MALTPRQQRFVAEYVACPNATQAYQRAGYRAKGNAAESAACRLLRNVQVKEAIQAEQARLREMVKLTQEDVVKGLHDEAQYKGDDASHSARVSAWRELGKILGYYPAERLQISGIEDVLRYLPPEFAGRVRLALETPVPAGNGEAAADPGANGSAN